MILESILTYHLIVGAILHGPPQLRENIVASSNDYRCLLRAVWHEARGESFKGQLFVSKTILNRTRSERFPQSICKVVYQKYQFSFAHQIPMNNQYVRPKTTSEKELLKRLEALSTVVIWIDRLGWDFTQESQFYHSVNVKPRWDYNKLENTQRIGNHIFYKRKERS